MIATNLTATSHWAAGQLARHSGFQFLFIVVTSALAFFVGCVLAELAIYEKKPVALSLTLPGIAGTLCWSIQPFSILAMLMLRGFMHYP